MEMSEMSERGPPTPLTIALFRFVVVFPTGIAGIGGIRHYNDIRKLEVLSMISQGPRFLQGLEIGGKVVCTVTKTARMG